MCCAVKVLYVSYVFPLRVTGIKCEANGLRQAAVRWSFARIDAHGYPRLWCPRFISTPIEGSSSILAERGKEKKNKF